MIRFSQQDARWKETQLGTGDATIGQAGCLLTCTAMACQARGYSETPASLNQAFKGVEGGFYGSLLGTSQIGKAVPGMAQLDQVNCANVPAPVGKINDYLRAGKIVTARVDSSPVAGVQDHWVILEASAGDDFLILDPWPLKENGGAVTLLQRYGGSTLRQAQGELTGKRTAAEVILGFVVFGGAGSVPVVTAQSAEMPAVGTKMKVVTNQVNERLFPTRASLDVGDLNNGDVIEVCGTPVEAEGIVWVPITRTHYVALGVGGEVYLEEV